MKNAALIGPLLLIVLCFSALSAKAATEPPPPWLQPEVVKAYLAIDLTDEQKPLFRDALTTYLQDSNRAIRSAINSNKGNLEREIRRRVKKHISRWNETVAGFLTDEQYPKFEVYRDTLLATVSAR